MRVSQEDDFEKQEIHEGGEESTNSSSKSWISYSFAAMLAFTINNSTMCEVTEKAGAECLQYFAAGFILSALGYNTYQIYKTGNFWTNQNIIVDGKFSKKNFIGFCHYFTSFFLIQFTAFGTFYVS